MLVAAAAKPLPTRAAPDDRLEAFGRSLFAVAGDERVAGGGETVRSRGQRGPVSKHGVELIREAQRIVRPVIGGRGLDERAEELDRHAHREQELHRHVVVVAMREDELLELRGEQDIPPSRAGRLGLDRVGARSWSCAATASSERSNPGDGSRASSHASLGLRSMRPCPTATCETWSVTGVAHFQPAISAILPRRWAAHAYKPALGRSRSRSGQDPWPSSSARKTDSRHRALCSSTSCWSAFLMLGATVGLPGG